MHFHDFMLDVHSYLRDFKGTSDPLAQVADAFTKRMRVLCLDEFFVTDVADAAVLSRLFGRMWETGLVLVATSNRYAGPQQKHCGGSISTSRMVKHMRPGVPQGTYKGSSFCAALPGAVVVLGSTCRSI